MRTLSASMAFGVLLLLCTLFFSACTTGNQEEGLQFDWTAQETTEEVRFGQREELVRSHTVPAKDTPQGEGGQTFLDEEDDLENPEEIPSLEEELREAEDSSSSANTRLIRGEEELSTDDALTSESEERILEDPEDCQPLLREDGEPNDFARVPVIVRDMETIFADRFASGDIAFLTLDEVEREVGICTRQHLEELFALDPRPWGIRFPVLPEVATREQLQPIPEPLQAPDFPHRAVTPGYAPEHVLTAAEEMMQAMETEIGKRLLIESAYRSPTFQSYLFLKLSLTNGSFAKTAKWVALPGRSEHALFQKPAVDFITANGISDQGGGTEFAKTKEFEWLSQHATEFGFWRTFEPATRYGYASEPWHWHYEPEWQTISDIPHPYGMTRIAPEDEWGSFVASLPLKPAGTVTRLLYRREDVGCPSGGSCIKFFEDLPYEQIGRIFSVVDIPVSAHQDCSKQMIRLLSLYAEDRGKREAFQFPVEGQWLSYSSTNYGDYEDFLTNAMVKTGTLTWRQLLTEIPESEARVGDLLIQPSIGQVDAIYADATIGHTSIIAGIAEDSDGKRYYLLASGSLPVTDFRVSRAENGWQGFAGWFDTEGYKHRANAPEVEFYRMSDFAEETVEGT